MMTGQMIKTFAMFGQYILPAAFSFGAVISVIGQRKRANIYQSVAGQSGKGALNGISWREFEMLVGQWFRHQGYVVTETGGVADGGIDLVLNRDGETYLVQCKQWKAFKVGVNIVRELLGVMAARGAGGGFIVTSGVFTQEAKRFASDCNIKLAIIAHPAKYVSLAKNGLPVAQHRLTPVRRIGIAGGQFGYREMSRL